MDARCHLDRSDRPALAELVDRQTDSFRGWDKAGAPEDYEARHEIVDGIAACLTRPGQECLGLPPGNGIPGSVPESLSPGKKALGSLGSRGVDRFPLRIRRDHGLSEKARPAFGFPAPFRIEDQGAVRR
jgi:hypothetical protein